MTRTRLAIILLVLAALVATSATDGGLIMGWKNPRKVG
jgi:hypothetical protein